MSGLLNTEKISGVFSDTAKGIGSGFKSLFSNVAKFGTNLATSASNMVTRLGSAVKTGVFSVANGIGSKVNSLFNVLSDFGSSIAKVASKATAKAASVVAKSLDDVAKIGAKTVTAVAKPATKLSAEALDALRGTGQFAIKPKVPAVKLNKTQLDYLRGTGEGAFDVVKTTAAAPSLIPDEFPGVTVPFSLNAESSFDRSLIVIPDLGCSSVSSLIISLSNFFLFIAIFVFC